MQEKMGRAPSRQPLVWDSQVLLHVLAHREDHAASKYLKKEFALPKRLESNISGGLGSLSSFSKRESSSALGKKLSFAKFSRR